MIRKSYLVVAAVLVAGAIATVLMDRREDSGASAPLPFKDGLLASDAVGRVTAVKITGGGSSVQIARDAGDRWTVETPDGALPVSADRVVKLLGDFAKARTVDRVSTSSGRWKDLELDPGTAVHVAAEASTLLDATFGKQRTGGGTYTRFSDEPSSYLVDPAPNVDARPESWELKELISVKQDDIQTIAFVPGAGSGRKAVTFTRAKKEDPFAMKDSPGADREKPDAKEELEQLFERLHFSRRVPHDDAIEKALAAGDVAEATRFDGSVVSVRVAKVGTGDEAKHYASVSSRAAGDTALQPAGPWAALASKFEFEVDSGAAERYSKGLEDFVKK